MERNTDYNTLIIKFLSKEITESELDELRLWLEKDPANCRIFDKENELWHDSGIRTKFDYFKTDKGWSDVSKSLGITGKRSKNVKILGRFNYKVALYAASFFLLLMAGALTYGFLKNRTRETDVVTVSKVHTEEGEKARVFLCDSTIVTLNSGSTLQYLSSYNINDRIVNLRGEAYFNVRTNPRKPFIVKIRGMNVIATGTKFNIFSYENEERVETTLEEGKINISLNDGIPLELNPGQQMVYFPKTNKTFIRDVSTDTYTSWKENKLRFIDVPFEEVLRQVSRRYNVVFEVRGKDLLDLKYTATFIDESIEDVMDMLKEVSPIKYKIILRTTVDDKKYQKPKIIIERAYR